MILAMLQSIYLVTGHGPFLVIITESIKEATVTTKGLYTSVDKNWDFLGQILQTSVNKILDFLKWDLSKDFEGGWQLQFSDGYSCTHDSQASLKYSWAIGVTARHLKND